MPPIASKAVKEVKLGNLTTMRDFTFVDDACRGLLAVASLDSGLGEVFNIGSNQEISIGDLFPGSDLQREQNSRHALHNGPKGFIARRP